MLLIFLLVLRLRKKSLNVTVLNIKNKSLKHFNCICKNTSILLWAPWPIDLILQNSKALNKVVFANAENTAKDFLKM